MRKEPQIFTSIQKQDEPVPADVLDALSQKTGMGGIMENWRSYTESIDDLDGPDPHADALNDDYWEEDDPRWEQVRFKEDYQSYFTGAVNRFKMLMQRNPEGRKAYIAALKDFISQAEASE